MCYCSNTLLLRELYVLKLSPYVTVVYSTADTVFLIYVTGTERVFHSIRPESQLFYVLL